MPPLVDKPLIDVDLIDELDVSQAVALGDHNFTDIKEFALHVDAAPYSELAHGSDPSGCDDMKTDAVYDAQHQSVHSPSHILNLATHHNKYESLSSPEPTPPAYDSASLYSSIYGTDISSVDLSSLDGNPIRSFLVNHRILIDFQDIGLPFREFDRVQHKNIILDLFSLFSFQRGRLTYPSL